MLDRKKVQKRREELKLSQPEAAKLAGFKTFQQWAKLEQVDTDARATTLAAVAKALRCKVDELLK
jgi:transcriptional regulator with XRE-family HTH domain